MKTRCQSQSVSKVWATFSGGETSGLKASDGVMTAGKLCETFKVFRILTPNPLDIANYRYQTGTDLAQYRYLLGGVAHKRDDVL